ncbi:hypothetical protein C2857_001075 [Epichloe festucae Fl1]|uniref:Expansin-like EG45 domain-containing protein n=1 Tax=Epichloe festucae (strain Fl1) TaxID=877507 RepID=A0A7S9KJV2_EPIFF|nr:hypothetical protein C2857_001075 [Epichloe festucae Fl1]
MIFPVISLLTLALAPLSMAAACSADHKRADVAPSSPDEIIVSNDSPGKAAACSVGHKKHRGKKHHGNKHHGKKTKHLAEGPPSSTDGNPVPPVKGEPGNGEPPKGEPPEDGPVKSQPGDGHPVGPVAGSRKFTGLGTSYGEKEQCHEEDCWQSGACSFVDYRLPAGIDGSTCVSDKIWNNGGHCGGCMSVSYKGKTITVMVTNVTGGEDTHLDMTPATMTKLVGYPAGGIDGISWEWIKCPIPSSSPLTIKMHGGASKYWFAATVENAVLRTDKVEVSTDNGQSWLPTTRQKYNMYVRERLPTEYVWVRATSVSGEQVVVKNVHVESGRSVLATTNY